MATSNNIITQRRHDLDNLRTFLTGLVVVHHTAIAYGGAGLGPYHSTFGPQMSMPLVSFNVLNQSFFMGVFFWISGRVSAQSLARLDEKPRGRWSFVKSKLLRLGLPALLHTIALQPLAVVIASPQWTRGVIRGRVLAYFSGLRGIRGPVWYVATLLVFDLAAATLISRGPSTPEEEPEAWRKARRTRYRTWQSLGWIGIACTSFFVRLIYPVGSIIKLLNLQPAFLTQYVFAYAVGFLSIRHDEDLPVGPLTVHKPTRPIKGKGRVMAACNIGLPASTAVSLIAIGVSITPYVLGGDRDWGSRVLNDLWGGWNLPAVAYAFWNEFSYAIITPSLVQHFLWMYSRPAKTWIWQARYSYAAFLVHYPVMVAIEVGIDQILGLARLAGMFQGGSAAWKVAGPVATTAVVGGMNVVASFCTGRLLVDYMPGLKRIV